MQPSIKHQTYLDFDGTLVLENSSRLLVQQLMAHPVRPVERVAAGLLNGPLQRVVRLGFNSLALLFGERDLKLLAVLWLFRRTLIEREAEILRAVAGQLTLNTALSESYAEPFVIVSTGLRPLIVTFLNLHPELVCSGVFASELMVARSVRVRLLSMRAKLRILRAQQSKLYYTDYEKEAILFARQRAPYCTSAVFSSTAHGTIFKLVVR